VELQFDFWILLRPILVVGLVKVAARFFSLGLLVRRHFYSSSVFNLAQAPFKRPPHSNVVFHQTVNRRISQSDILTFRDVELPDVKGVPEEKTLVIWNSRLQNYWKASPTILKKMLPRSMDIERYSNWWKLKSTSKHDSLNQILELQSHNFPKELIGDLRRGQRSSKKMQWNRDSGLEKLDMFEKFEKGFEDQDKEGKEKKGDGEEDNREEEPGELSDESYSDDGDYNEFSMKFSMLIHMISAFVIPF
ncbi:hypothetical protein SCA6_019587, partial [Theobroma cacao]